MLEILLESEEINLLYKCRKRNVVCLNGLGMIYNLVSKGLLACKIKYFSNYRWPYKTVEVWPTPMGDYVINAIFNSSELNQGIEEHRDIPLRREDGKDAILVDEKTMVKSGMTICGICGDVVILF